MSVKVVTEEESKVKGGGERKRPLESRHHTGGGNSTQPEPTDGHRFFGEAVTSEDATAAVVLLALYLQGWREASARDPKQMVLRAWKGYNFDILNRLQADGMIFQKKGMKSVLLNPDAQTLAESLKLVLFDTLGVDHD